MANNDPCIVVLQLTGGNDYLNTTIPYNNPLYRDNRKAVGIAESDIVHLDKDYGIPKYMSPMKSFWDTNQMAILHGVGWKDSPRSHFRAMDIWHTCEPEKVGTEGWLGRVAREFDPNKENVVQVVSMGPSLPRSLVAPGVPVACVAGPLERYGFLPQVQGNERAHVLDRFAKMYSSAIGSGPVMDYLSETATDSLKGEDIIKEVPGKYSSTVQYPNTPIARKLMASRRCISAISARGSSTATTAPSTRMPARTRRTAIFGAPSARASMRSSPTCASITSPIT